VGEGGNEDQKDGGELGERECERKESTHGARGQERQVKTSFQFVSRSNADQTSLSFWFSTQPAARSFRGPF